MAEAVTVGLTASDGSDGVNLTVTLNENTYTNAFITKSVHLYDPCNL